MGKYRASFIHDWFSNWHWQKCGRKVSLSDIDRMWAEIEAKEWKQDEFSGRWKIKSGKIVAIFDLKYPYDSPTNSEEILIDFYENKNNIPFYRIYILDIYKGVRFTVFRPKTKQIAFFSEDEMVQWIKNHCPLDVFQRKSRPAKLEDFM